jgi:hypothetical protein
MLAQTRRVREEHTYVLRKPDPVDVRLVVALARREVARDLLLVPQVVVSVLVAVVLRVAAVAVATESQVDAFRFLLACESHAAD